MIKLLLFIKKNIYIVIITIIVIIIVLLLYTSYISMDHNLKISIFAIFCLQPTIFVPLQT